MWVLPLLLLALISVVVLLAGSSGEPNDICLYTSTENIDANKEILDDNVDVHDEIRGDGEHMVIDEIMIVYTN